ncbi:MAG: hypothetical protein NTU90_08565, partial [Proteobacteria bacterium]|nr:hypothetical protein [Pseudomonadota bacterium]
FAVPYIMYRIVKREYNKGTKVGEVIDREIIGGWVYFGKYTGNFEYFYHKNVIKKSKDLIEALYKYAPNGEKGIREHTYFLEKNGFSTKGYKQYGSTVQHVEIDRIYDKHRILSIVDYDESGNVLQSWKKATAWDYIYPGTMMDHLSKKLPKR